MTKQGPVPAVDGYRLCFEHGPWPSLLVDRARFHFLDINAAARELGLDRLDGPGLQALILPESLPGLAAGERSELTLALATGPRRAVLLALNDDLLLLQLLPEAPPEEILRLEHISQRKSELIANISHELRTPLTAILGWPEIILDSPDMPPLAMQAAQSIRKDGVYLRQLLDDLIDLSRIEAGHLQLDIQSEDLKQIVLDAIDMLGEKARQKKLSLIPRLPANAVWVAVDPVRVLQVVLNYLSNAIKYSHVGGEIFLEIRTEAEDAILSLQDSGIGMDDKFRQHVFERFTRAEDVQASDGAGIGLNLVKKLVELHSGRCWVESSHGQGSTFYVALPLTRSRTARELRHQAQGVSGLRRLALTQLLLIDERSEELGLLEQLLKPYFRQVRSLSELPDLSQLQDVLPDLILISTSLQDIPHQAWLTAVRQDPELNSLPVIALSASAMKGDAEKLTVLGYSGSLSKPFLKEDLLQYIQEILARTSHV